MTNDDADVLAALRTDTRVFTVAELDEIIEEIFTDDTKPMNDEMIDAAILRRAELLGEDTTPKGLQAQYEKIAYKYLRRSLGLAEK